MDKFLAKCVKAADKMKTTSEDDSNGSSLVEIEDEIMIVDKCDTVNDKNDSDKKETVEVTKELGEVTKTPEIVKIDSESEDNTATIKTNSTYNPSTPTAQSVQRKPSLSSTKKRKTESEKNLANQIRLENLKKKEEEERERKEARLKLEEERKKRKLEEEERKKERLKREEENRKRRGEEEERKAENRRKMEELRQKREEDKIKREEERIKQMEEKLKRDEDLEKQKQERLEKERLKKEEKRLKEEEKAKEEEEMRRKADLIKNKFSNFFNKIEKPKTIENKEDQKMFRFMSFQLKEHMTQAPKTRREDILENKEKFIDNLDEILQNSKELTGDDLPNYLIDIRKNPNTIRKQKTSCRKKTKKTVITNKEINIQTINEESVQSIEEINIQIINEESVQCIEEIKSSLDPVQEQNNQFKIKVKYLHFDKAVYRRPPYYGTWRKKSKIIRPKNPFGMDDKLLDYEVDSDGEWEEIVDGESIADSDEDEEKKISDDEDDDGFMVPHGHLSDDELDEDERQISPEERKIRESAKTEQWETERKKSSKYIVQKCYFTNEYWNLPDSAKDTAKDIKHLTHLKRFTMVPFLKDMSPSLFPFVIQTEEKIKHEKKLKELNDEAIKKAKIAANLEAKLAEKAANAEAAVNSPTTTTPKTKLKKKISENATNLNPQSSPLTTVEATKPTNTSSILKFVSKMSNRNVIAKPPFLSKLETEKGIEDNKDDIQVIGSKPPLPNNKIENSPKFKNTIEKCALLNTPTNNKERRKSVGLMNPALQTTPSTAEKRANSSTGETVVKRMKLEENQPISVEKKQNTTPSIITLFKNTSCQKKLQLNNNGNKNTEQSVNSVDSPKAAFIKKTLFAPTKRDSIDGVIDSVIKGEDLNKMDTESIGTNKENNAIVLD